MDQLPNQTPEINPETLELARDVITELGFGNYVNSTVTYGDQTLTIAEGLAYHWDESVQLDGEALYNRVLGYVTLAQQQEQS